MKKLTKLLTGIIASLMLVACSHNSNQITGAGSSFIYPALSIWAKQFANQNQIQVNYQAIGSGGGLQQIYASTIDFAASDMPLSMDELKQHKLKQFPMIIGGIVMAVNVPGIANDEIVLSGDVLEGIYMGKIRNWNDQAIKRLNPKVQLPNHAIITIHRADGSGTTFNFTNYLSKISSEWERHIGANTTVAWPGNGIGAKGNAGVAAQIMQTPYSIGYVEYAYAKQNNMNITKMLNRAHKVVSATSDTFAAAAQNADWTAKNGFYQILTDQPGAQSWPIVATTFILVPNKSRTPKVRQEVFNFFKWCYSNGSPAAEKLDYVAVPQSVYSKIVSTF